MKKILKDCDRGFLNVFKRCVLFIEDARKKRKETTIFYIPFLSWWHYHFQNIGSGTQTGTQIGVELHQSGPRNKPTEVSFYIISSGREGEEAYSEEYRLRPNSSMVRYAARTGDRYMPLSAADLEEHLPLLEEVIQKLTTSEVVSNS